jgi:glycogen operon protein
MSDTSRLGAIRDGDGVRFRAYSSSAERIEVCLFSTDGEERERHDLAPSGDGRWALHLSGVGDGQQYGYRVSGPWQPAAGHRFNRAKLLIDPYALALTGEPTHDGALRGCDRSGEPDPRDSASFAPRSIVVDPAFDWGDEDRPDVPWAETVIYECHVRGMTMRHPEVPEALRGTWLGLASAPIVEHLRSLGVTTVELLPVAQIAREPALARRGLANYFGYNPLAFLAPHVGYTTEGGDPVREFKQMVRHLHAAGFEVLLDVVLNHTAEGDPYGPTLSLRGWDNGTYYRLDPDDLSRYRDFTGCGNTLDARQPAVQELFLTTLAYWAEEMHVDGFRFDLAPALGRDEEFDPAHAFFTRLEDHPTLSRVKLVAEPWDLGPDGYQLGNFPGRWREWNDRFRDPVRRFWRGEAGSAEGMRQALSGSPRVFTKPRDHTSSIDFVTCHDGFTLADLVSHERKHNQANGESNRDGSDHNLSRNWGVEGPTDDPDIREIRERVRRSLLATLALTRGVPMLLHGDELGRTQQGNNNAYCHDSVLTWVDWDRSEEARDLLGFVQEAMALRSEFDMAGEAIPLSQDGRPISDTSRIRLPVLALLHQGRYGELLTLWNASDRARIWRLPFQAVTGRPANWFVRLASFSTQTQPIRRTTVRVPAHAALVLGC